MANNVMVTTSDVEENRTLWLTEGEALRTWAYEETKHRGLNSINRPIEDILEDARLLEAFIVGDGEESFDDEADFCECCDEEEEEVDLAGVASTAGGWIDPNSLGFDPNEKDDVKVYEAFFRAIRPAGPGFKTTLLACLITEFAGGTGLPYEGRASRFAKAMRQAVENYGLFSR